MVALDGITQVQQHIAVVVAANFLHNGGCRRAGGIDAVGRGMLKTVIRRLFVRRNGIESRTKCYEGKLPGDIKTA